MTVRAIPQPLFSTPSSCTTTTATASASCGQEAAAASSPLVIQRPPVADSFSWSDFPVIEQQDFYSFLPSSSPSPMVLEETPSCVSSLSSLSSEDEDEDCNSITTETQEQQTATSLSSSQRRRVRFDPTLEVRSYDVILGDHPMCPSLPVSLGWECQDVALLDLETHEDARDAHQPHARRRSYLERKQLLLWNGYTMDDLNTLKHSKQTQSQNLNDMVLCGDV